MNQRKVIPGEPLSIKATTWNKVLDLVDGGRPVDAGPAQYGQSPVIVQVKNVSGSTVPRFGILALGNPIIDSDEELNEFQSKPNFEGSNPATGNTNIAITLHPLENNAIGPAMVAGVVACKVTGSPAHTAGGYWATVTNGDATKLTMGWPGPFRVIWSEPAKSGERWAYVSLPADVGTGITVQDWNFAVQVYGVQSLQTDVVSGLYVSNGWPPYSRTAIIRAYDASQTQKGVVNITTQSFAGAKTFSTSVNTPQYYAGGTPGVTGTIGTGSTAEAGIVTSLGTPSTPIVQNWMGF